MNSIKMLASLCREERSTKRNQMHITEITVNGLFGIFNHVIPLNIKERITIIHGPNGYGKTIILKMINGLLSSSYEVFYTVPFSTFIIRFDDNSRIEIKKSANQATNKPPKDPIERSSKRHQRKSRIGLLNCKLVSAQEQEEAFQLSDTTIPSERQRRDLDRLLPGHLRLFEDGWMNLQTNTFLTAEQVLREYGTALIKQAPELMAQLGLDPNSPLARIQSQIHGHLIATERLQKPMQSRPVYGFYSSEINTRDSTSTAERYSKEIVSLIGGVLATYAGRASELDRTFPERLLQQSHQTEETRKTAALATAELKLKFEAIEKQRAILINLGFLDVEQSGLSGIPEALYESAVDVLTVYVQDTEEKLATFNDIATKIGLFIKIVNARFTHKQLKISREKGFVFESQHGEVSPTDLSSGEQHELVLLYELLFKVDNTWLVMLDEPEISLHVGWQERFLGDLQEIVKISNVDVLIATHSPIVIGEHWDLTVPLKTPEKSTGVR